MIFRKFEYFNFRGVEVYEMMTPMFNTHEKGIFFDDEGEEEA